MRKIQYPEGVELDTFKKEYKELFSKVAEQKSAEWDDFKKCHPGFNAFKEWSWFLDADFSDLVDAYEIFKNIRKNTEDWNGILDKLKTIFGYDQIYTQKGRDDRDSAGKGLKASTAIAEFFMDKVEMLGINTCFYCGISYANVYVLSKKTPRYRRHFDLDHVIPKGECPLFSLSLFNFVPSCKSCNQSLKSTKQLGDGNKYKLLLYSPSSKDFSIDNRINFDVIMTEGPVRDGFLRNRDQYSLKMERNHLYDDFVKLFHLEERYDYHKDEALRLLDLRKRYPRKNIEQIANLLKLSPEVVTEDIFGEHFTEESHRSFAKLRKDILKKY